MTACATSSSTGRMTGYRRVPIAGHPEPRCIPRGRCDPMTSRARAVHPEGDPDWSTSRSSAEDPPEVHACSPLGATLFCCSRSGTGRPPRSTNRCRRVAGRCSRRSCVRDAIDAVGRDDSRQHRLLGGRDDRKRRHVAAAGAGPGARRDFDRLLKRRGRAGDCATVRTGVTVRGVALERCPRPRGATCREAASDTATLSGPDERGRAVTACARFVLGLLGEVEAAARIPGGALVAVGGDAAGVLQEPREMQQVPGHEGSCCGW